VPEEQEKEPKKIHVVDVVRHGSKLILPEGLSYDDAIEVLQRKKKYEEEVVTISDTIPVFPWDGALALAHVLEEKFGVVFHEGIPNFFGQGKAQLYKVDVSATEQVNIPWGIFLIPKSGGTDYFQTSTGWVGKMLCFQLTAQVRRKFEPLVTEIAKATRKRALSHSIYRAKAIRMRFTELRGGTKQQIALPVPKFIDLSKVDRSATIFTKELEKAIETNILTPLMYPEACRAIDVPLRRGVLLAGPYGCGKTLLAHDVAQVATANKWTYIYIEDVSELPYADHKHESPKGEPVGKSD
jgi:transitional endoplasmic reticulum ATPase